MSSNKGTKKSVTKNTREAGAKRLHVSKSEIRAGQTAIAKTMPQADVELVAVLKHNPKATKADIVRASKTPLFTPEQIAAAVAKPNKVEQGRLLRERAAAKLAADRAQRAAAKEAAKEAVYLQRAQAAGVRGSTAELARLAALRPEEPAWGEQVKAAYLAGAEKTKRAKKPQPIGTRAAAAVAKVKVKTEAQVKAEAKKAAKKRAPEKRAAKGQGAGYEARKAAGERALEEARKLARELGKIAGAKFAVGHFAGTRYILLEDGKKACDPMWAPRLKKHLRALVAKVS